MKKFGLVAVVAGGLAAGLLGVASPIQAVASAEVLPVLELPGYSTGTGHAPWVGAIQPQSIEVDAAGRQGR